MTTIKKSISAEYCPQAVSTDNGSNFMNIYDDYSCDLRDNNSNTNPSSNLETPSPYLATQLNPTYSGSFRNVEDEIPSESLLVNVKTEPSCTQAYCPSQQNSFSFASSHVYNDNANHVFTETPLNKVAQASFFCPEPRFSYPPFPGYSSSSNYMFPLPNLIPQSSFPLTVQPIQMDSNFNYQMDLHRSFVVNDPESKKKRKYTKRKNANIQNDSNKMSKASKKRKISMLVEGVRNVELADGSSECLNADKTNEGAAYGNTPSPTTEQLSAIKLKKAKMAFPKFTFLLRLPDFERDEIDASHHVWCVDNHQLLLKYVLDKTDNLGRYYVKSDRYSGWLAEEPWHYAKLADLVDYEIIKRANDKTVEEIRLRFPSEEVIDELLNKMHVRIIEEENKKTEEMGVQEQGEITPNAPENQIIKNEIFPPCENEN